jgi:heme/copper-type cytochrome/quinol oxidase subunit 4
MLETPHVAVGAAIATKIPNPFLAIPLAFASHFVLEHVPHWNPHLVSETKKYGAPTKKSIVIIAFDVSLALVTGSLIAWQVMPNKAHAITIMFASFASVLPDLIEAPYFFLHMRTKFLKDWLTLQKSLQVDTTVFWGLLTQLATIAAAILWLKN